MVSDDPSLSANEQTNVSRRETLNMTWDWRSSMFVESVKHFVKFVKRMWWNGSFDIVMSVYCIAEVLST